MKIEISILLALFSLNVFGQLRDTSYIENSDSVRIGKIFEEGKLISSFNLRYEHFQYFTPDSAIPKIVYEFFDIINDSIVGGVGTYSGNDYFRNGEIKTYFKNGSIESVIHYDHGLLNGKYELYYKDGSIAITGAYKDHARIGPWQFYNKLKNSTIIDNYNGTLLICWLYPKTLKEYFITKGYKLITSSELIKEIRNKYCKGGICDFMWINE